MNDIQRIKVIQKHFNMLEIIKILNRSKEYVKVNTLIIHVFRDNWGRKWCHLVAIDATYFRDRSTQFEMKHIKRELIKAYAGFHTRELTPSHAFPVATGNWGCGAFNGDRQLKGIKSLYFQNFFIVYAYVFIAIIQLIAASEAIRPLIYATYGDKQLVESFAKVYDYLIGQRATVGHLYRYLKHYSNERSRIPLFQYILRTPVTALG